jgi:outer membrane protein assembly factor BamD (BamD/ComL family)
MNTRFLFCSAFALLLLTLHAGCSSFSPFGRADKDYEATRRSINGQYGEGVYRPEGVSAEKGDSFLFLDRMGLSRRKRKDITAARQAYAMGDTAFNKAKELDGKERRDAFRAAATQYQKAADNWKSSQLEQDALLMKAESQFFAEDYYKAEQTYAKLVKEYPRNPYLDQVDSRRFEIADYWLKYHSASPRSFAQVNFTDNTLPWNDTGGHGKRVLENLRMDNPLGKLSDDATMRLAVNYFEKGDYEAAASTFGELRMTYPDSQHQFNAQFLELQSLLLSYLGPEYSDVPLIEAEKRVRAIVRLFPTEAAAKQMELREAAAKTKYLMAEREWESAYYRYRQGENLAARMYLEQLIEKYPDTPYAESSRELIAELDGKPDRPAQRFAPLVKIFRAETDQRSWTRPDSAGQNK